MRIAILTCYRRIVGGCEVYLKQLLPLLLSEGHELALAYGLDEPKTNPVIAEPGRILLVPPRAAEAQAQVHELQKWKPDVLYLHGLSSPSLERAALSVGPAVLFVHVYYGMCISGHKTFSFPRFFPCHRQFGWRCLLHYYPHRCGGLSPFSLWNNYVFQRQRFKLLKRYAAVITHSQHMASELVRHGISCSKVHKLPFLIASESRTGARMEDSGTGATRLLFLGRMDRLKGGSLLLRALPTVARALNRPLVLTMAGDGPERARWESQAHRESSAFPELSVSFPGWVQTSQREQLFRTSDLLVVPSVWPEPFGLVGPEAGFFGVPAAAFDVGGISEWLHDGVNGFLAPGNPPTPTGLAHAILRCLLPAETHAALRVGALRVAQHLAAQLHVRHLLRILEEARHQDNSSAA